LHADGVAGAVQDRRAVADGGVGDADAVLRARVLDLRLHHAVSWGDPSAVRRTAYTRTASPIPFSANSPRSSNTTPADVRARSATVRDTSTRPGADSPQMREAMLTAPP